MAPDMVGDEFVYPGECLMRDGLHCVLPAATWVVEKGIVEVLVLEDMLLGLIRDLWTTISTRK